MAVLPSHYESQAGEERRTTDWRGLRLRVACAHRRHRYKFSEMVLE